VSVRFNSYLVCILSKFSIYCLKLTLIYFYFLLIIFLMNSDVYEKFCLLRWELLVLFLRIKTAIATRFYLHIPQPENPLKSFASVFKNTWLFEISMILETTPFATVGKTSSIELKMLTPNENLPKPRATISSPI